MAQKYINLNSYPVIVPAKHGGQQVFRAGESSTDPWFSKFVGRRQLTTVPLDYKFQSGDPAVARLRRLSSISRISRPALAARGPTASAGCQSNCETTCQTSCEADRQAVLKLAHGMRIGKNFYQCAYCSWQGTTDKELGEHTATYHSEHLPKPVAPPAPVPVAPPPTEQPLSDEETGVEETAEPVVESELPPPAETSAEQSPTPAAPETPTSEFPCAVCGKRFGSIRGLRLHERKHSEQK